MTTAAEWVDRFARLCERRPRPVPTRWVAFLKLDDDTYMPLGRIKGTLGEALTQAVALATSRLVVTPDEEDET